MSPTDGYDARSPLELAETVQLIHYISPGPYEGTQEGTVESQDPVNYQSNPDSSKDKDPQLAGQEAQRRIEQHGKEEIIARLRSINLEQEECKPNAQHGNA